jgi:hypothetical protein
MRSGVRPAIQPTSQAAGRELGPNAVGPYYDDGDMGIFADDHGEDCDAAEQARGSSEASPAAPPG